MSHAIALPAAALQNRGTPQSTPQSTANVQNGSGTVQATSSSSADGTATAGQTFESVLKDIVKKAEETSSGNTPAESPGPEASSTSPIAVMAATEAIFPANAAAVASAILPLLAQLAALTSADKGNTVAATSHAGSISLPASVPQRLTASDNDLRETNGDKSLLTETVFGAITATSIDAASLVVAGPVSPASLVVTDPTNSPVTGSSRSVVTDPASAAATGSVSQAAAGSLSSAVIRPASPASPTNSPVTGSSRSAVTDPASSAVTASQAATGPASPVASESLSSAVTPLTSPSSSVATSPTSQADSSSDATSAVSIQPKESAKSFESAIATAISAETDGTAKSGETGKALIEATPPSGQTAIQNLAPGHTNPVAQASRANSSVPVPVDTPFNQPGWSNEVGDKLTWMVTSQRQQAELVLNPPQLGRIDVSLTVTGDQATATFASPNAAVREMLENSLPRLREILAGAGINLGESQVGAESQSRFGGETADNRRTDRRSLEALATADALQLLGTAPAATRTGRGMVDIFA